METNEPTTTTGYTYAGNTGSFEVGSTDRFPSVTASDLPAVEPEDYDEYADDMPETAVEDFFGDVADPEGRSFEVGRDDVGESFTALKESFAQGRELKAREKERAALAEQLHADRAELADRDDILANYAVLLTDQKNVITYNAQERADRKAQVEELNARIAEVSDSLDRMRAYHDQQLLPLQTELGRARAIADQAKNDERSRKSELSAADSELRKAEGDRVDIAAAQQQVVAAAYEEARARSEAAKASLADIEKSYDVLKRRFDGEEAPLENNIADMNEQVDALKAEMADFEANIDEAQARYQYIEEVYHNPDVTEQLRQEVAADEATERQMADDERKLRMQLEDNKARAQKAKLVVAAIVAVIIILVIIAVVLTH